MARDVYRGVNESLYACSLEELSRRNRLIMIMFAGGLAWAWMFIEPLNVQWFFEESWLTYNALGDEAIESEVHSRGGIWWSLLGTLLVSVGLAPLTISFVLFTYRSKGVTEEWLKNVWTSVTLIPIAAIWALLWLVCLPVTWWLLPWGEWSESWWKIFPFLGLGFFGGFPLIGALWNTLDQLRNPKYIFDEGKEAEVEGEEEESSSTSSESIDPGATLSEQSASAAEAESNRGPAITALSIGILLNIIGLPLFIGSEQENLGMLIPGAIAFGVGGVMVVVALFVLLSSWVKSHAKTGKSAPGWTKVMPVFGIFLMIPGIVLLIIGGVMAEEFIEDVPGFSSYTLEIIDEDSLGDQGFIIFIPGTPGDFNGNGMHDYCENVIVNATHSGAWMSDPWTGWSSYNEADETRQVFELEISHEGSGCDAQHWPKEKWINDGLFQLVKLGRACNGCMAGNTTITAEYANEPQPPVGYDNLPSMWIQDGEALVESTLLTVLGATLTGIGALTVIGSIVTAVSLKEARRKELEEEKEPIEIIGQAAPNQPVPFRINSTRLGRDSWVGIYPVSADDQDHGGRWSWLRAINVNYATLPGQPAGKWSIRVFKDGGYSLKHRLDFEIYSPHHQPYTPTSSEGIVAGNTTITTSKSTYTIDEGINFSFTASKLPDDAWIGIVPVAIPHGDEAVNDSHDTSYEYLGGRTKGDITLPNPGLGTWTLRLHDTDNNGRELTHVVFEVVSSLGSSGQRESANQSTPMPSYVTVEVKVAFKSVHGKYLSAQPDGRAEWNRDRADAWEYFHLEKREGGKIALKGAHGMYVSAQKNGTVQINRREAPPGGWEEFTVEARGNDVVCLKSCHGKYLSAQQDGTAQWNRDHAPRGGGEDIKIEQYRKTSELILSFQTGWYRMENADRSLIERARVHQDKNHQARNEFIATGDLSGDVKWYIEGNTVKVPKFGSTGTIQADGNITWSPDGTKAIYEGNSGNTRHRESATITAMPSYVIVAQAGSPEVNGNYEFMPGKHENRHFSTIAGHYQHTQNPEIFIAFQDCGTNHQRPEWNKWMIISKVGVLYAAHTGGKIGVPPREGVWENVEGWGHPGAPGGKHPVPTIYHPPDAATQTQQHLNPGPSSTSGSDESIQVLEAVAGKPIRFKLNNPPNHNDAWVCIYPRGAPDYDHGEQNQRWKYIRDINVNNVSLSYGEWAEGDWSIRVFSDGGFNQIGRLDFVITDNKFSASAKKIQSAVKGSSESGSTNFWDTVG